MNKVGVKNSVKIIIENESKSIFMEYDLSLSNNIQKDNYKDDGLINPLEFKEYIFDRIDGCIVNLNKYDPTPTSIFFQEDDDGNTYVFSPSYSKNSVPFDKASRIKKMKSWYWNKTPVYLIRVNGTDFSVIHNDKVLQIADSEGLD